MLSASSKVTLGGCCPSSKNIFDLRRASMSHPHSFAYRFTERTALRCRGPDCLSQILQHPRQTSDRNQFAHREAPTLDELRREFAPGVRLLEPRENLPLARDVDAMRAAIPRVGHVE